MTQPDNARPGPPRRGVPALVLVGLGAGVLALAALVLLQLRAPAATAEPKQDSPPAARLSPTGPKLAQHVPAPARTDVPGMFQGTAQPTERTPTDAEKQHGLVPPPEPGKKPIQKATQQALEARLMHTIGRCFAQAPIHAPTTVMLRLFVSARGGKVTMSRPPDMIGGVLATPEAVQCARNAALESSVPMRPDDAEGDFTYLMPLMLQPPPPKKK